MKREGLQAALWSAGRHASIHALSSAGLPAWLNREHGVSFHFGTAVIEVDLPTVKAGGVRWQADRVWVCSGHDFETLFPQELAACGMVRCKLQMMRSQPLEGWRLGPMLAAGLTLRHYRSFEGCPTLPALKERVARESPWFDDHGIHVLVSQTTAGELTLGDSHEYGDAIEPFDKSEIDALILGYLGTFLEARGLEDRVSLARNLREASRELAVIVRPCPAVTVITGVGGAGMTLSFGLAEQVVRRKLGEAES